MDLRTRNRALVFIWLTAITPLGQAAGEGGADSAPPEQGVGQIPVPDEGEEEDIIPRNAELLQSTQAVTPVTRFPEKPPYDQAREALARALALWAQGDAEAASDTALEAYDDLLAIHRRKKSERKKLHAERRRAAVIYVEAGIRFIRNFVDKQGGAPQALKEGRSRLEDLRDVARDYEDLNRALNKAIERLSYRP